MRLPLNLSTTEMGKSFKGGGTNGLGAGGASRVGTTAATSPDYINYESINQDLLHLAKKINGGSSSSPPPPPPPPSSSSKLADNSFRFKNGALYSSSSRLNYIIPEMLTRAVAQKSETNSPNLPVATTSTTSGDDDTTDGRSLDSDGCGGPSSPKKPTLVAVPKQQPQQQPTPTAQNNVVYCDIDFIKKTPAFHSIHKS